MTGQDAQPHHEQGQPGFEYSQITDSIYIGTNQCCTIHMDDELLQAGIVADISLEKENLDHPFGAEFFLWLPTADHTAPTQAQLRVGVNAIHELIAQGKKVYVHCKNGHGRAPTLVAAYLISQGKTVEEAITYIAQKRPSIHLEGNQKTALTAFFDGHIRIETKS